MALLRLVSSSRIVISGLLALQLLHTPMCSAQTPQQIMDAACANDIRQQASGTLWESMSERRTSGHVYVERTIETVDGDVNQLISVDGHSPDGPEKNKNDKTLEELLHSPQAREAKHKAMQTENQDAATLMRALPKMFLLEDRGQTDGTETIAFEPDPSFQPQSIEQRAIHGMSGAFYVERKNMRLTGIDAIVPEQVKFGLGLLGTLEKGGTYMLRRIEVGSGVWKTQNTRINHTGHVAVLKNISKQSAESKSGWHPVPPNTTVLQAFAMFGLHL
ncbi:MAG: hypothetical protein M3Y50_10615 [Acidobacteriota bacterium]|nr:hypothetical protein [Acidobacteriota bacterium]